MNIEITNDYLPVGETYTTTVAVTTEDGTSFSLVCYRALGSNRPIDYVFGDDHSPIDLKL